MVVVIEEIRAETDMASGKRERFQREKIGEDSIGDGVVGRKARAPFLSTCVMPIYRNKK